MLHRLLVSCLLLAILAPGVASAVERWILVDTSTGVLEVRSGDEPLLQFPSVSHGRGGVSDIHLKGDRTTPRGEYRITRINDSRQFHRFIGLDYPTADHLDAAHRQGLVDTEEYRELLDHLFVHGMLPHDSSLGGHIGIHGIGDGDPDIHERFHWTLGCIALTNEEVTRLAELVDVGTRVVIR